MHWNSIEIDTTLCFFFFLSFFFLSSVGILRALMDNGPRCSDVKRPIASADVEMHFDYRGTPVPGVSFLMYDGYLLSQIIYGGF